MMIFVSEFVFLSCLVDLFYTIATQKKKVGSINPKRFIARLRKEKGKKESQNSRDAFQSTWMLQNFDFFHVCVLQKSCSDVLVRLN